MCERKSKPICFCLTTRQNLHENDRVSSYKSFTLRTRFKTKVTEEVGDGRLGVNSETMNTDSGHEHMTEESESNEISYLLVSLVRRDLQAI